MDGSERGRRKEGREGGIKGARKRGREGGRGGEGTTSEREETHPVRLFAHTPTPCYLGGPGEGVLHFLLWFGDGRSPKADVADVWPLSSMD